MSTSVFASKSLTVHLLRGAVGLGSLGYVMFGGVTSLPVWVAGLTLSIVAFRGCPTCWTLGLIETVLAKLAGRPSKACVDGSCAISKTES